MESREACTEPLLVERSSETTAILPIANRLSIMTDCFVGRFELGVAEKLCGRRGVPRSGRRIGRVSDYKEHDSATRTFPLFTADRASQRLRFAIYAYDYDAREWITVAVRAWT